MVLSSYFVFREIWISILNALYFPGGLIQSHQIFCIISISYITLYEDDIVVITRDRGGAEVECNNNNIIRVTGYNWLLSRIR